MKGGYMLQPGVPMAPMQMQQLPLSQANPQSQLQASHPQGLQQPNARHNNPRRAPAPNARPQNNRAPNARATPPQQQAQLQAQQRELQNPLGDTKTALNQFCQKFCQRPLTKDDIVYTTNRFGDQYQTIVELVCLQGEQFAGETKFRPKEAERSAAQQALQAHAADILNLPPPMTREERMRQRRKDPESAKAAKQNSENNPALTPKVKLNELCMKIAQRYLKRGESVYTSRQVLGGYQATVQLTCLPEDWNARLWAGEVCPTKQKAEQSAADIAMQQILSDPQMMELAESRGKDGKGRGKGKWDMSSWGADWFFDFWSGGPDLPREKLDGEVQGEVTEWKEKYGWIRAAQDVDHDAAALRGGKIYVSQQDIKGNRESLEAGQAVRFKVYVDSQGLGAEDVEVLDL